MGVRLALVVCIAALATASVALAGEGNPTIKGAKRASGPYATGTQHVKVGDKRNLYVRVVSNADEKETWSLGYEVNGGFGTGDYAFKWFRGKTNITDDVDTANYEFKLRAHEKKTFRVRVKTTTASPEDACMYPLVHQLSSPISTVFFALNGDALTCV